jgi:glycosyltransferase involved in cell wall biosynthesis
MPSILFINRVYPPDSGATGRVLEQAALTFVRAGWGVTILSTAGDQPSPGAFVRDGVKVIRTGGFFSKSSLVARAAGYALMIPSLLLKALMLPRADVVVTMTDPPMLAVIGPILRLLKGSRLVHWAQDLYPEVAEEVGVFRRGGGVAGAIRALSTASLKAHHLVVSLGRCMSERLALRGIPGERVRLIPNIGMERDIVPCRSSDTAFRARNGIAKEELVVMYSGNLGRAHEFVTVLGAARLLKDQGEQGILFLFVGEGPSRLVVEREAAAARLSNVRFLPSQPGAEISESLGSADLHLVTMRHGMSGLVVPSKFYGVLAAERPCLFVGPLDSEVARVILEVGCGEVIRISEGAKLAATIQAYRDQPDRISEEGGRGLQWLRRQSDTGSQFLQCLENQNCLSKK